ncbi:MAG: ArsR family transcriptional regulator [Pseudobdellovibrionaceae bacterium]|jgi:predicted transcriptional regulator
MNTLTFKYRPGGRQKLLANMKAAIKGKTKIEDDIIYFESLDMVDCFINPMKAKIIRAIQQHKPESIYELSKILKMDQGYIQKEVKFLENLGIIKIESLQDNGRTKSKPHLIYDTFLIDLGLGDIGTVVSF